MSSESICNVFKLTLLSLLSVCDAFPSGAPVESCASLLPRHMGSQALDLKESPYYLVQSSNSYGNNADRDVKGIKGMSELVLIAI